MMPLVRVVMLCLLFAVPASAQMKGTIVVGAGVGKVKTTAKELKSTAELRPIFGRLPSRGWGFAFALNWFDADVIGSDVGIDDRLGRVAIRPLMFGVGYTAARGPLSIAPSVVAGPSLNTLRIDDRWDGTFSVGGTSVEKKVGTVNLAVRPGVNATYALAPRLGVTAFGGYLFNRPAFTINTPNGAVETKWNADGIVVNAGVIVSF